MSLYCPVITHKLSRTIQGKKKYMEKKYICENCKTREVERHNETVRDKNTKIAKIMSVCNFCFRKITGAK